MKIQVEIDCTPDEARRFLGLPDLAPMQEAVMARLQARMVEAVSATGPEALVRAWSPFLPQTPEQVREQILRLFTGGIGPAAAAGAPGSATPPARE